MMQKVSAPAAVIILALVILVSLVIFNKPQPIPQDEVFILPFSPPIEDSELLALRKGVAPMGIAVVMPPLVEDRFKGARVAAVASNSPADKGGMKVGDLITEFNGIKVTQPFTVASLVMRSDPKKPNEIMLQRAKEKKKLTITGIVLPPTEERGGL